MALARTIIQDALIEIGVFSQGEAIKPADAQLGLRYLQGMIDSWRAESLTLAVNERVTFTIPSGENTLTIGTDGTPDIDAERPTFITMMNYIVVGSSPEVEVTIGPMDDDQYASLSIKELSSTYPLSYYFNATTPNGELFFWPTVSQDVDMALYYRSGVARPATLDSVVIGPAGYEEAFRYGLAERLLTPFAVKQDTVIASVRLHAGEAMARMKRPNTMPGLLGVDAALVPTIGGAYNVISDSYTGQSR